MNGLIGTAMSTHLQLPPRMRESLQVWHAASDTWVGERIALALQFAPSTYYAAAARQLSARARRDEELKVEIARVQRENLGIYGIEKVWHQLSREGVQVGRDRVHRLMDELDLEGVVRGKRKPTTTMATEVDTRPDDLVERNFTASAPNALWVADLTYVSTQNGFCYVAFVIDVFSRFIVGWRVSRSLHAWLGVGNTLAAELDGPGRNPGGGVWKPPP